MSARPSLLVSLPVVALLALAPAATADTTTNCAGLQAALTGSAPGDTITLNQMCTVANSGASLGQFQLPAHAVTLQGQAGAGFDGTGVGNRMLDGNNVGATRIANLIFQDGAVPANQSGGGLRIQGASMPTLDFLQFYGNAVTGNAGGGGASITTTANGSTPVVVTNSTFGEAGRGNSAGPGAIGFGGGLNVTTAGAPLQLSNSRFVANQANLAGGAFSTVVNAGVATLTGNLVQENTTNGFGGGAYVYSTGGITLTGNSFLSNHVSAPSVNSAAAGGLSAQSCCSGTNTPLNSTNNVFDSNTVSFLAADGSFGAGGGAQIENLTLDSHNDRYTNNTLQGPTGDGESEGAALSLEACAITNAVSRATQLVMAGNQGGAGAGARGSLYIGCTQGNAHLQLFDSTIAGNTGGAGSTAGAWGDPADDKLDLFNTIVAGNSGGADITGFQAVTADHSDACLNGAAVGGTGTICADPKLVAPGPGSADVHQTLASPTIDAGSNALLPAGLATDYFGGSRTVDFRGGGAIVDIGAQELPPATLSASDLSLSIAKSAKIGTSMTATVGCLIKFAGTCGGELSAGALVKVRGSKVVSSKSMKRKKRRKARKKTLPLGSTTFAVANGKTQALTIKLSKKNRKKLAKLRSAKVLLTATFHVGASKPVTKTATVRYKIAKKKQKKRKRR